MTFLDVPFCPFGFVGTGGAKLRDELGRLDFRSPVVPPIECLARRGALFRRMGSTVVLLRNRFFNSSRIAGSTSIGCSGSESEVCGVDFPGEILGLKSKLVWLI